MKFLATLITGLVLLCATCQAQTYNQQTANRYTDQLYRSSSLDENVRLRFAVLGRELGDLNNSEDLQKILRFFSDTRIMVWNKSVSPTVQETMLALEQQMLALAVSEGSALDLHPVGYAPRGQSNLISSQLLTINGLTQLLLDSEASVSQALMTEPSPELQNLQDSLTILRQDLSDRSVLGDNVNQLLSARVKLLLKNPRIVERNPDLASSLNNLVSAIRGSVSTADLRSRGNQSLSLTI